MSPELINCGLRADLSDSVIPEGRIEVLRHRSIVAKLLRIVVNKVPTRKLQAANLSQHFFSIDRLKAFLLGLIRRGTKHHLPLDHRDSGVPRRTLLLLVTVEHVTVNEGGKAIVGNVTHGEGKGDIQKI